MNFLKKITLSSWVAIVDVIVLLVGLVLYLLGYYEVQKVVFLIALIVLALPLWFEIIRDIFHGKFGVDLIAGLAIVGAWLLSESLAGLVVVLMLSGGQALEAYAMNRAQYELTKLLTRTPKFALRKSGNDFQKVPIDDVVIGDEIMIKSGEIIPVDGTIVSGTSMIDESAITGESLPVEKTIGGLVISGTENTTSVLVIRADKKASEGRYAKIVALVKNAQESRAPMVRLADRYAIFFTAITLGLAAIAYIVFHDPIRVLAVLVVATPCPLILATPIAIISGMSRAAKRGVIIKQGAALETLAQVRTMFFDKTGTITIGVPTLAMFEKFANTSDDIVQIAASLDHGSSHILARSLEKYIQANKIAMLPVTSFHESFGEGVLGTIETKEFFLGKIESIESMGRTIPQKARDFQVAQKELGNMMVFLADKNSVIGALAFADTVRDDAQGMFQSLVHHGVNLVMLTGDHLPVAAKIAQTVGIETVHADCEPEDKLLFVDRAVSNAGPVAMIGDGVNDAPALARADVGIAIAHDGDTASSDAADIVILHGSLGRVIETYFIAQKTVAIAKQGIFVGIGLSVLAMILAVFGFIQPLAGALLQEGIDVVVILGALRVLFVVI